MNKAKDLFENEELMNDLVEDLDDLPEDSEVFYAVWAIGYDKEHEFTEDDHLIGEFEALDDAIEKAESVTLEGENIIAEYEATAYFSIEVDTVVVDHNEEECSTASVDTVYHRELWLDGEYGSIEEVGLDGDPIIAISASDYELLEDNTLKIKAEVLKDFNENDSVNIYFTDDADSDILECRIMSKDTEYCNCELVL